MKICINNQCKHELDDYQERCPYCGWSQKSFAKIIPQKNSSVNIFTMKNLQKLLQFCYNLIFSKRFMIMDATMPTKTPATVPVTASTNI